MSFIAKRSGSQIGGSGDKEKEKDKEFMAKMLRKEKEVKRKKKTKKKTGGEDSDDDSSDEDTDHSSSSSSTSSDEEEEEESGGRRLKRSHSISALLGRSKKGSAIKGFSTPPAADAVKVRFNILLKLIVGLPSSANDRPIYVVWKRGRKRQNRGETKHIRSTGGVVMWGESIWLEVTMAAHFSPSSSSSSSSLATPSAVPAAAAGVLGTSPAKPAAASSPAKPASNGAGPQFDKKSLLLSIKREGRSSSLGKLTIDLAEYAADGTNASKEYKIKMGGTKKGESKEAVLTVQFKSEWLKVNNKKLVRKGSLIQVAAPHVDSPTGPVSRPRTDSSGAPRQLTSMASLVGSEFELVTDSEAEYSETDTDMTADTDLSESDFSGSETDSDDGGWEIDSKQVELKRENARLKHMEKQLAGLLDKAKKDIESKDRHILQLKVELEKKKERNRRMNNVASIMSDMGIAMDDATGEKAAPQEAEDGGGGDGGDGVDTSSVDRAALDRKRLEGENQELRKGVAELRDLLERKDEELTALGEQVERLEQALRDKDREAKQLKKDIEKEKVQRIDMQINKEKEKLEEVERAINDKNEIKRLKQELRSRDKELTALSEQMASKEAQWRAKAEQYEAEVKSLSRTIENFGRTKW